jgi:hypothetical protein
MGHCMGGEADSPGIDAMLAFGTASAPLTGGVLDRPQLISQPNWSSILPTWRRTRPTTIVGRRAGVQLQVAKGKLTMYEAVCEAQLRSRRACQSEDVCQGGYSAPG